MSTTTYRSIIASALATGLLVTACGGGGSATEGTQDDPVQLRFAWWGSDLRNTNTEAIIDDFEEEYPHIEIEGEYADWSGYVDQLATQFAGGGAPDIVQLDDEFIREYADRGSLLELDEVDVADIDPTVVEGGQTDGTQYAIPTGINALVMMGNPEIFDAAGLDMPDDTTWTWEEFEEIAQTIHEETGEYSTTNPILQALLVWVRQHGEHLFTDEGELGLSDEEITAWFDKLNTWNEDSVLPSASEMVEEESAVLEDSLTGTGQAAMGVSWSNQLPAFSEASGAELAPLRFPSQTGEAEDNGLWFKNTMLLGASADTEHPEEAQLFIDYMINSEDAGMHNMMDRGLPANESVREAVVNDVEGQDEVVADLLDGLDEEITEAEPMLPLDYEGISDSYTNQLHDMYFDRLTPEEAAAEFITETEQILDSQS